MVSRTVVQESTESPAFAGATRGIVVGGLAIGAAIGFGGNFVEGSAQSLLYAISAVGLIVGSILLAVEHASLGHRIAAAGFVVLALGETRVLNPVDAPGGEASFTVGVLLYAPALLLIALSTWPPRWVRLIGAIAAVPFAAHALVSLAGGEIDSTGPIVGVGYALFTITVVGWIVTVLRSEPAASGRPDHTGS